MKTSVPARGYLEACLLLLLAESPGHGYDLGDALAGLGVEVTDSGRVYRALREMEREGLVVSWWQQTARGPARRMYHLTERGGEQLQARAALVGETRRHLSGYLARWRRVASPHGAGADGLATAGAGRT
jgi:PadR family transcriptional regulator PadR